MYEKSTSFHVIFVIFPPLPLDSRQVIELSPLTFVSRPVNMNSQITPQMAQPGHSAGQMLAQMSRQNGVPHSVTPSSNGAPLHGGPTGGGWPGPAAGARPQFNNQV